MVSRLLKLFSEEVSGLHEAAFLLAVFGLGGKLLSLFRDRLLAHYFGAGSELDIYYAAFRIPDFLYVSLASLVASAVLIPFIVERLPDHARAEVFFQRMFTLFFFAMAIASISGFFLMPYFAKLIAPGFGTVERDTLIAISRIMMISPFFLGLSGLFASVTQSLRRFFIYALAPLLYNLGIILGIIFFYPLFGLSGLAYGVLFGAALHMLVQLPALFTNNFVPKFIFSFDWREMKEVLFLSLPRTLTVSASHLTILILTALASFMTEGSISIFNLSFNLQSVPLTVIGLSYTIAAFPTLARLFSSGEKNEFVAQIISAARHIIFWSFPALVFFIVLRAQIVRTVLGSGEFGWASTRLTAAALALFAISIIAQSLILLFVRGYYAAGFTKKPLIINLFSSALIVGFSFLFVAAFQANDFFKFFIEALLRVSETRGTVILMLPLAFSLGTLVNLFLLWFVFTRDFSGTLRSAALEKEYTALSLTSGHSFSASILAGFTAFQALHVLDDVFDINTFWGIFAQGFLSGVLGIIAWLLILMILKNQELKEITRAIPHRFWRKRPVAPDQTDL